MWSLGPVRKGLKFMKHCRALTGGLMKGLNHHDRHGILTETSLQDTGYRAVIQVLNHHG